MKLSFNKIINRSNQRLTDNSLNTELDLDYTRNSKYKTYSDLDDSELNRKLDVIAYLINKYIYISNKSLKKLINSINLDDKNINHSNTINEIKDEFAIQEKYLTYLHKILKTKDEELILRKQNVKSIIDKVLNNKKTLLRLKNISIEDNINQLNVNNTFNIDSNNEKLYCLFNTVIDLSRKNAPNDSIIIINLEKNNNYITFTVADEGAKYVNYLDKNEVINNEFDSNEILDFVDILYSNQICESINAEFKIINRSKSQKFNSIIIKFPI